MKIFRFNLPKVVLWGLSIHRYLDFVIMAIIVMLNLRKINIKIIGALILVALASVCQISYVGYSFGKFIQQYVLLSITILGCDILFKSYVKDVEAFFMKYVSLVRLLAIIGLIQFIIYAITNVDILAFTAVTQISLRIRGWLAEPGWYAAFLTPAVAYYLYDREYRKKNKWYFRATMLSYLLSLSALAYFALFLMFIMYLYNRMAKALRIIMMAVVICSVLWIVSLSAQVGRTYEYDNDDFMGTIEMKIVQSFSVFNFFKPEYFEKMNASTYATMTNLWVACNAPMRVIGTGLGTHELNYESEYRNTSYYLYGLNKEDAYSLFTRIFSEFGVVGVIALFLCLFLFHNRKSAINRAIFIYYMSMLIRGGSYTMYGIVLFAFMYYYTGCKKIEKGR